jgi:uncharacterized SAM-binding protein YcdF (DUF218 family)
MALFLRKLAECCALPLAASGLVIVAAVVWRRRWMGLCGVLLLWVPSTSFVSRVLLRPLEGRYEVRNVAGARDADAIVVLSGGTIIGRTPAGLQYGRGANRYFSGVALASAGRAPILVFTGAPWRLDTGQTEGDLEREAAIEQGIPADRIHVTGPVATTADEAKAVSQMPGIHSVLLVTSAYHMRRAVMLFEARGIRVLPYPTDVRSYGTLAVNSLNLLPSPEALNLSEVALKEYYGLAFYRITSWLGK